MRGYIGLMSKYGAFKKNLHTVFIDTHFVPLLTKNPENTSIFCFWH